MSAPTLVLDPPSVTSPSPVPRPRHRRPMSPIQMLRIGMMDSEQWAVEFEYADSKGKRTRRTVSPIRLQGSDRFLGLCLCREEPRQFYLSRCSKMRLVRSETLVMPVEMVQLS